MSNKESNIRKLSISTSLKLSNSGDSDVNYLEFEGFGNVNYGKLATKRFLL